MEAERNVHRCVIHKAVHIAIRGAHDGARGSGVKYSVRSSVRRFVRCFAVSYVLCTVLYRGLSVCPSVHRTVVVRSRIRTRRTERPPLRITRAGMWRGAKQAPDLAAHARKAAGGERGGVSESLSLL